MEIESIAVLLIEDNPAEARLMREMLGESTSVQFRVLHVERLAAGLECLAQGGVDAVLLDLSLPDGHGIDTFRAVHSRAPQLPIVVLTGLEDENVTRAAIQEGAQDYLTKQSLDGRLLDRSIRYAVQRKRAEEERVRRLGEQSARAQAEDELRARDQFLSIAAHELKTPITVMLGYAQSMQRRARRSPSTDPRDEHAMQALTAQVKRMSRLVSSLLDLSRLQSGTLVIEPRPLDLGVLVSGLVEELQPGLANHTLEFADLEERVIVEGDELRLEQVFYNLLQNAVKYSPDGGSVKIVLERHGSRACVAVSDHGIGIPADALPHLGTLYYRGSNLDGQSATGMGLGLFTVKQIVALHQGALEVISVLGEGSTFKVCLPRRDIT